MSIRRIVFDALTSSSAPMPQLEAALLLNDFRDEALREERDRKTVRARRAHHAEAVPRLKAAPGRWRLVGTYANPASARNIAYQVRAGALRCYRPAGAFEARLVTVSSGVRLYVRYAGAREGGEARD